LIIWLKMLKGLFKGVLLDEDGFSGSDAARAGEAVGKGNFGCLVLSFRLNQVWTVSSSDALHIVVTDVGVDGDFVLVLLGLVGGHDWVDAGLAGGNEVVEVGGDGVEH